MPAYLTALGFKERSLAPASYTDFIETAEPGWTDRQLELLSAKIDARLAKRYAAPFASPYPIAIVEWLTRVMTPRTYLKRGIDATDAQFEQLLDDAKAAWAEIAEAANSETGLFELPLRADTTVTGVSKGAPMGYTEVSPYTWSGVQRDLAEDE